MSSDTRDRILDALEMLLLDEGSTKVTLESVAASAGVSKGGLLYHFNTKDAMIAAMVRRLGERSDTQRAEAERGGSTGNDLRQRDGSLPFDTRRTAQRRR